MGWNFEETAEQLMRTKTTRHNPMSNTMQHPGSVGKRWHTSANFRLELMNKPLKQALLDQQMGFKTD